MILYYIRHADPIYDPDSLTPLGIRQAEALAKRLALYGVEFVEKGGYAVPKILTLSSDSHIYREGLPTRYNNCLYF